MKLTILGLMLWAAIGSVSWAEEIMFHPEDMSDCVIGAGWSEKQVITTKEEYEDLIYNYHKNYLDYLVHLGKITPADVPADYKDKLMKLRDQEILTEAGYVSKIDSKFGQLLKSPDVSPFAVRFQNCQLPNIDFARSTLIIKDLKLGGCHKPLIEKHINNDPDKKAYIINLDISEQGFCQVLMYQSVWFVVPKLPEGYQVLFDEKTTINEYVD